MRRERTRGPGLLEKAGTLRSPAQPPSSPRGVFVFDPDSGISRADQKDIIRQIEHVASANRIAVGPAAFAVKAAKRGVLFPVLVNLAALVALAGGLGLLYLYFQRGETQLAQGETGTITAEGKLIEEVKKESEARLAEKNQQISRIQDRLAEIDRQRQELLVTMDAKVRDRETQLKTALAAELETERGRLRKQGLSGEEARRRLSALEAQKNAQSAGELAAFRTQAEADRRKADDALGNLKAEFTASLAQASQERQTVLDESAKREADLQARLEQKTREAQSAQARSDQALSALQSRKREEDLVSAQLVGLYSVVKADMSARDYPGALAGLQAIRDFVNRTDIAGLPAVQQRRDVDLFVVDSLAIVVRGQLSPATADTSSLAAAAAQISQVRDAVSRAEAESRAGNNVEAEKLYDRALSVIPEIAKSYGHFTTKAREVEAGRQEALRGGLARAEAAFDAGRYTEMLAAYRDALAYLPETSARLDRTLSNILAAGSEQPSARGQAEQARAAAPLLAQADAALAQGKPADAISRYLTILQRFPQSPQAASAVPGMTKASAALADRANARLAAREKDLGAQVAALQKQLADRTGEINAIQKKLDALAAENARLTAQTDRSAADAAARQAAAAAGEPAQKEAAQELSALRARLSALTNAYSSYTSLEDQLLRTRTDSGLVDAKPYRDGFLRSSPVEETFPGLSERIRRYDQGFSAAGRSNAIQEVLDLVIEMSRQTSPDARARFLARQLAASGKDKDMSDLVKGFQKLLK